MDLFAIAQIIVDAFQSTNVVVHVYEDAGHFVNVENTLEFNNDLIKFELSKPLAPARGPPHEYDHVDLEFEESFDELPDDDIDQSANW